MLTMSQPESCARMATKLAQTRHHVRGNPYLLSKISDDVPAVTRPTQLEREMIETWAA
jgi:hypothetical protein